MRRVRAAAAFTTVTALACVTGCGGGTESGGGGGNTSSKTLTYWASNQGPNIEADKKILTPELKLARHFLNSLIVAGSATVCSVIIAIFAAVDGCGPLGALFRVVVPAAVPGIVAVAVYAFMTAWGEVLFASVMTNEATSTLAVGLQGYSTQNDVYWNQIMAASLVVSVPVVVGFATVSGFVGRGWSFRAWWGDGWRGSSSCFCRYAASWCFVAYLAALYAGGVVAGSAFARRA